MPTINYEVETRCFNCGDEQDTQLPRNHSLTPYDPVAGVLSSYFNKYRTKLILKRCWNCKEPKLIPIHLWDEIVGRVYETETKRS